MTTPQLPPAAPISGHARVALWALGFLVFMSAGFIPEEISAPFATHGTTDWLIAKAVVRVPCEAIGIAAILLTVPIRAPSAIALARRFGRAPVIAVISLAAAAIGVGAGLAYRLMAR